MTAEMRHINGSLQNIILIREYGIYRIHSQALARHIHFCNMDDGINIATYQERKWNMVITFLLF